MENKLYPEFPVLVVDDDKDFLNSIDFILRSKGINNIDCCDDSLVVLSRLESKKYSVILLDLKMKGKTGEELLIEIANKYPELSVIIISGLNRVDLAVNCMIEGAYYYIVKPPDTDKLIKTIKNAINKKNQQAKRNIIQSNNRREVHVENSKKESQNSVPFSETETYYETKIYIKSNNHLVDIKNNTEVEFLKAFFQFKKFRINVKKILINEIQEKELKLDDIRGLIFRYLAYKNHKALKNSGYHTWTDIPGSYEFRFSSNPENNKIQTPEWNVLSEYLKRNERTPDKSTIRQWIFSLKNKLEEYDLKDIIDSSEGGRGKGYLLKGVVEFCYED